MLRSTALLRGAAAVVLASYPVLVWQGLDAGSPRALALALLCVVAPAAFLRLRSNPQPHLRGLAAIPMLTAVALGLAALLDGAGCMLLVPVAINAVLLLAFGGTLRPDRMPMIERFARLQESSLTREQQAWCRLWTKIWCGFFALNGSLALALALAAPLPWWAFYNGLIAYGLIGALCATEWALRRRRFSALAPGGEDRPR